MSIAPLFQTTDEQIEPLSANITGSVPKWLKGDYLVVGPGVFDLEDFSMNHWCDGFAVVCKFSVVNDNQVTFTKRYLSSDAYIKAKATGKPIFTEFGTKAYSDPSKGFFSKMLNNVMPEVTDNVSNCAYKLGNTVYVATESANKRTLNVETLESEKKVDLGDIMKVNLACSHVYFDPDGTGYTIGTSLMSGVKTQIYKLNPQASSSGSEFKSHKALCSLPTRYKTSASFSHSFGVSEKQIVFIEQPLIMNGMKLLAMTMKGKSMWDTMEWKPEDKNRFTVVDKASGAVSPIVYESDRAFFFYHVINTYQTSYNELVVDVVAHDSHEVMDKLWLKELRQGKFDLKDQPAARRFVLPLFNHEKELRESPENENLVKSPFGATAFRKGDRIILTGDNLTEPSYDLPTVSPNYFGKKYTFFYASSLYGEGSFQHSVVKVNVDTRDVFKWTGGPTEFPGEPYFVPTPGGSLEDDGVLLAVVADTESKTSFLLILDASTMAEIARASVTSHTPCLIHGLFIEKS